MRTGQDLRRVLTWEPEHDLCVREELGEPLVLRGCARERRIANMVGRPARRRQKVRLEHDLQALVDCAEAVDELGLEGGCDDDAHHAGTILPMRHLPTRAVGLPAA